MGLGNLHFHKLLPPCDSNAYGLYFDGKHKGSFLPCSYTAQDNSLRNAFRKGVLCGQWLQRSQMKYKTFCVLDNMQEVLWKPNNDVTQLDFPGGHQACPQLSFIHFFESQQLEVATTVST